MAGADKTRQETWTPGSILELSGYYWRTCTLHAAVQLDVFTVLDGGAQTAAGVAATCGTDEEATARLLNALVALGLVVKQQQTYHNTQAAHNFLSKHSQGYLGYMIGHHHQLMESWSRLHEAVQTGRPVRGRASVADAKWRENFLMGMFNNAMLLAPRVVAHIDLEGRRRFLDLGGGPGTYAIHFCRRYPQLNAVVFDLPATRPFAEKTIAGFGLADRIRFKEGNFLKDDLGRGYDVAWLSHILHGEGPDQCRRIVQKAAGALRSGGMLLIHEFILENDRTHPLFPALFSLNMLLGTDRGQAYSEAQLREMAADAGGVDIRRIPIDSPNDSGVISAIIS